MDGKRQKGVHDRSTACWGGVVCGWGSWVGGMLWGVVGRWKGGGGVGVGVGVVVGGGGGWVSGCIWWCVRVLVGRWGDFRHPD